MIERGDQGMQAYHLGRGNQDDTLYWRLQSPEFYTQLQEGLVARLGPERVESPSIKDHLWRVHTLVAEEINRDPYALQEGGSLMAPIDTRAGGTEQVEFGGFNQSISGASEGLAIVLDRVAASIIDQVCELADLDQPEEQRFAMLAGESETGEDAAWAAYAQSFNETAFSSQPIYLPRGSGQEGEPPEEKILDLASFMFE